MLSASWDSCHECLLVCRVQVSIVQHVFEPSVLEDSGEYSFPMLDVIAISLNLEGIVAFSVSPSLPLSSSNKMAKYPEHVELSHDTG